MFSEEYYGSGSRVQGFRLGVLDNGIILKSSIFQPFSMCTAERYMNSFAVNEAFGYKKRARCAHNLKVHTND